MTLVCHFIPNMWSDEHIVAFQLSKINYSQRLEKCSGSLKFSKCLCVEGREISNSLKYCMQLLPRDISMYLIGRCFDNFNLCSNFDKFFARSIYYTFVSTRFCMTQVDTSI